MTRRLSPLIPILTAAIFLITAQTLLLNPFQKGIFNLILDNSVFRTDLACILLVLGLLTCTHPALLSHKNATLSLFLTNFLVLGFLSAQTFLGSLYIYAVIFAALAIGCLQVTLTTAFASLTQKEETIQQSTIAILDLGMAAAIVLPLLGSRSKVDPLPLLIGGLFVLCSLLSLGSIFFTGKHRNLIRLQSLPWFLSMTFFAYLNFQKQYFAIALLTALIFLFQPEITNAWDHIPHLTRSGLRILALAGGLYLTASVAFGIFFDSFSPLLTRSGSVFLWEDMRTLFLYFWLLISFVLLILLTLTANLLDQIYSNLRSSAALELPTLRKQKFLPLIQQGGTAGILSGHLEALTRRLAVLLDSNDFLADEEKANMARQVEMSAIAQQLTNTLDPPVAAQFVAQTLQRLTGCGYAAVFVNLPMEQRLAFMASYGPQNNPAPLGFRLSLHRGLAGRAIRMQRSIICSNSDQNETITIGSKNPASQLVAPLIRNGYPEGVIVLMDDRPAYFEPQIVNPIETVANLLLAAWGRYQVSQSLSRLIQSNQAISNVEDFPDLLSQITRISRSVMQAQFAYLHLIQNNTPYRALDGKAPELSSTLDRAEKLISELSNLTQPLRIRDIRKDPRCSGLHLDNPDLRTLLVIPIRLRDRDVGLLLIFGKKNALAFQEEDLFLAELLSSQMTVAIETNLLTSELRSNLHSTQLLHELSMQINQAEDLNSAVRYIAQTAYGLTQASSAGIVLFAPDGKVEAQVCLPLSKSDDPIDPMVVEVIRTREVVFRSLDTSRYRVGFPIQTPLRCYGALWLEIPGSRSIRTRITEELRPLIHQAAVSLERAILLAETRQQAQVISAGYVMLENTYDQTLFALSAALDARDHETEGHSLRVTKLASALGNELNINHSDLKILERGALLHDIGKIGITDTILNKPGSLSANEWEIMREHPIIGAHILNNIPFLKDSLPIILSHQERWDGSGYPSCLKGKKIPLLARIFSVADVFDALTSNRPYHERISASQAHEYITSQSGIQFDPKVVLALNELVKNKPPIMKEYFDE